MVTNLTGPQTDEYENAAVTRGEVMDIRRPGVRQCCLRYLKMQYKPPRRRNAQRLAAERQDARRT